MDIIKRADVSARKTRVLQISKYYYPFIGATEQVAKDMAAVMSNTDNVEQKIICFNENAAIGDSVCQRSKTVHDIVDGVEVIRCGYQLKVSSQALSLAYGKELKKLIYEFGPDIIILHYPNPFVTHYLLKYKNRKFKLIVYWHLDITKQKLLKHLFRRQNVKLIERANKILDTNQSTLMNQHLQRCSKERNKFFLI